MHAHARTYMPKRSRLAQDSWAGQIIPMTWQPPIEQRFVHETSESHAPCRYRYRHRNHRMSHYDLIRADVYRLSQSWLLCLLMHTTRNNKSARQLHCVPPQQSHNKTVAKSSPPHLRLRRSHISGPRGVARPLAHHLPHLCLSTNTSRQLLSHTVPIRSEGRQLRRKLGNTRLEASDASRGLPECNSPSW